MLKNTCIYNSTPLRTIIFKLNYSSMTNSLKKYSFYDQKV